MIRKSFGAALVVGLLATACSGANATQPPPDTDAPTTTGAERVIEVTAVDFGFEGLPETIPTGSTLTLVNESQVELHELVAVRLPDGEERTVGELLESPEDLAAYFASVATVVIAPPGEGGIVVEGTGRLDEPGRYAIVCAIPTGADPGEYMEAAAEAEGGPPEVAGGPPHFVHGMFAEVTVEG